ncbi:MAG: transposase family protein [bacterium]|nr:transposase family protein [bacterium]
MANFDPLPSPIARFRYLVISAVLALILQGWRRSAAVREVAGRAHFDRGSLRQVSVRSVWRWLAAYEAHGLAGLELQPRARVAESAVLPERFLVFLKTEHAADPRASIPELIRRARLTGTLHPKARADRSTVWRAMRRMKLDTRRKPAPHGDDTRRFAYLERMQLVMVDFKHFRAGATRKKRVAIYFLDDATRYGLGVQVAPGSGEPSDVVLRALAKLLRRYGRMDAIYWDHGPGFIADDSQLVCTQLEIPTFFGAAAYPQGHGKIERFNRSVKARLLRTLDRADDIDPDCGALQLRLDHDLFDVYNHLPHESLDGDTPYERWTTSARDLRPVDSDGWLQERFTLPLERKVSNDHVISYAGTLLEVPRSLRPGRHVFMRRLLEDDALYAVQGDRLVRLHPLDPHFNATSNRAQRPKQQEIELPPSKAASTLAFEQAYPSLVDADGGFTDPQPKREDDHE